MLYVHTMTVDKSFTLFSTVPLWYNYSVYSKTHYHIYSTINTVDGKLPTVHPSRSVHTENNIFSYTYTCLRVYALCMNKSYIDIFIWQPLASIDKCVSLTYKLAVQVLFDGLCLFVCRFNRCHS